MDADCTGRRLAVKRLAHRDDEGTTHLPDVKLAVVAAGDPLRVSTWSGTPYFMTEALRRVFPDLLVVNSPRPYWFRYARRLARRATGGRIDLYWSRRLAAWNASRIGKRLNEAGVDVAVCIANAPISAFLNRYVNTVHVSDATVPLMRDYYAEFARLQSVFADSALSLDRMSVLGAGASLYSTEWAANSAVRDYGADPSRTRVVPWGANIPGEEVCPEPAPAPSRCDLVFIGVDWERKGGALAVAAVRRLAAAGRDVTLHVVGAQPRISQPDKTVIVHGFVSKGTAEGRAKFDRIMRDAAFLFVPTRQDCSPMVFAEANSYGVPVISTDTGGVGDVIREGVNGRLLAADCDADAYADLIWATWSDRPLYERLRKSARDRFERVLNWNNWLELAAPVIRSVSSKER